MYIERSLYFNFLNGVCRHELMVALMLTFSCFLNGVCRHEPKIKENAEYATGKKDAETTVVGSQAASVTTAFDPNIECRNF